MKKRPLLLVLLAVLVLGGAYAAYWWQAAAAVRRGVEGWAAEQRARGGSVEHAGLAVTGFPLELVARARDVAVRLPEGPVWRGPEVVARARPWNPTEVALSLPGLHRVELPADGARPALELEAAGGGTGHLSFDLAGALERGHLALVSAALGQPGHEGGRALAERLRLGLSRPGGEASLGASLSAEAVRLPEGAATPLGRSVERAGIETRVLGPMPAGTEPAELTAWSQAGGALSVDRLDVAWGPLRATGTGRLDLDPTLVPRGALDAEILGASQTLDALAAAGAMSPRDAALAKAAVGFLSRKRTTDGEQVIDAPVVLRDGWLSLGPVRLARLPRLGP